MIFPVFVLDDVDQLEDELAIRIYQFASFLPILHLGNVSPWNHSNVVSYHILSALRIHDDLSPYFHSIQGGLMIKPMYYESPDEDAAYNCPSQFMIGDEMIVSPIVQKQNMNTNMASVAVWFPEGIWFNFDSGRSYTKGWHGIHCGIDTIPVFIKSGSIILTKSVIHLFPSTTTSQSNRGGIKIEWRTKGFTIYAASHEVLTFRIHNLDKSARIETRGCEVIEKKDLYGDPLIKVEFQGKGKIEIEGVWIDKSFFSAQELTNIFRAANVKTWINKNEFDNLHESDFFPRLISSTQNLHQDIRLLLMEEIADCGFFHFTREMGKDVFILWNTTESDLFRLIYKKFKPLNPENPITETSMGLVPKERFFIPENEKTVHLRQLPDIALKMTLLDLYMCDSMILSIKFDDMIS